MLALKMSSGNTPVLCRPSEMNRYPPRDKLVFSFVIKIYSKELPVTYSTVQLTLETDCRIRKLERFMHLKDSHSDVKYLSKTLLIFVEKSF